MTMRWKMLEQRRSTTGLGTTKVLLQFAQSLLELRQQRRVVRCGRVLRAEAGVTLSHGSSKLVAAATVAAASAVAFLEGLVVIAVLAVVVAHPGRSGRLVGWLQLCVCPREDVDYKVVSMSPGLFIYSEDHGSHPMSFG